MTHVDWQLLVEPDEYRALEELVLEVELMYLAGEFHPGDDLPRWGAGVWMRRLGKFVARGDYYRVDCDCGALSPKLHLVVPWKPVPVGAFVPDRPIGPSLHGQLGGAVCTDCGCRWAVKETGTETTHGWLVTSCIAFRYRDLIDAKGATV